MSDNELPPEDQSPRPPKLRAVEAPPKDPHALITEVPLSPPEHYQAQIERLEREIFDVKLKLGIKQDELKANQSLLERAKSRYIPPPNLSVVEESPKE